jgi:integrase
MAIAYMDQIRLSGASNRTYNGYLTDMRTFFNAMAEREMIRQNYFREIKFLKLEDKHRNAFTTAELSRLKDYLTEHDKNFLLCCYYCYYAVLRPVEICRLKVEDINLKEGYIRIDTHQSKNDKAQTIPILPELAKLLKELAIDKQPAKNYIVSHGFVPGAKKLRENEISRQFKRVATAIDLPEHTTFYSLKDTIAERLIGAGYDIKFIQRFFRHHDITITDAYMSKFNPVLDIKLIDKFPAF